MKIQTFSGDYLDLANLQNHTPRISDIAHALALTCRFSGHCRFHYSVAQHSVLVATLVPEELALPALLHDAAEAYLSDIATPIKRHLSEYRELERRVQNWINDHFGVDTERPEVKRADLQALVAEKHAVMMQHRDDANHWSFGIEVDDHVVHGIHAMTPLEAESLFIDAYLELTGVTDSHRTIWPGDFMTGERVSVLHDDGTTIITDVAAGQGRIWRRDYPGYVPVNDTHGGRQVIMMSSIERISRVPQ